MGFFDKLKTGLNKTKTSFDEKINNVFSNFRKVDEDFLDELEEVLIMSDIGMDTSIKIISSLREKIKKEKIQDEEDVKQALREEMQKILDVTDIGLHLNTKPSVILVVGVNGVGKTTSIGKMANRLAKAEKKFGRGGMNIRFANALSRELKQWLKQQGIEREFYLVIFAYNYSSMPPVKWENGQYVPIDETVKAEDNVVVRIATIKENCYYPLQSDMHFVPISKQIAGWKAVCKNIMTWTYHKNFKCFLWYFPTIQHWKQDCKFLKDNAVFYNFMQSNHLEKTDWISEIELYVAGKMLWNIETDPYAVRKEFIRLFYGVAAPFVNKIIRIFDGNYKKIAKKSEKLRRQTFLKVNGIPLKEAFGIHDMNALGNMLLEESKEEWTHNVYFSLYHKEIMWAKSQPKELLEKQLALVFAAKNKVKAKKYQKDDENRIILGLEKIELAVRFMILYNYNEYYGEKGKAEFAKRFVELCDKFNYEYIGELRVSSFSDFIDKGCDLC